ncbi:YaaA family protein [Frigoribacterium sp. 2-23]|uniref:YaaA family protein n=1 Tax=Frigoribacterium sp. 2-23 TaxID=3415006 RepID=UPI003C6F3AE1
MLFLLPPSETKLGGGSVGSRLDLGSLAFPELTSARSELVRRVAELGSDVEASRVALKLGPRQDAEIERNRDVLVSATRPALTRYTGVLFDPIGASALSSEAWAYAARHLVVHSALFGLVSAGDAIPAYRLSHDSRVPGLSLKAFWRPVIEPVLASRSEFVLDLRSEGYAALGPLGGVSTRYLRVVSDEGGRRRALNHFNKKSKGLLVRALLDDRPALTDLDDLVTWASHRGIRLDVGDEITLVSESVLESV